MSEFNGKKFYGFSLHNDPALSTSTRNFEFRYTRPEQLERAIQRVQMTDQMAIRQKKNQMLSKCCKMKKAFESGRESTNSYARDPDVDTHISQMSQLNRMRPLSETEVEQLIDKAKSVDLRSPKSSLLSARLSNKCLHANCNGREGKCFCSSTQVNEPEEYDKPPAKELQTTAVDEYRLPEPKWVEIMEKPQVSQYMVEDVVTSTITLQDQPLPYTTAQNTRHAPMCMSMDSEDNQLCYKDTDCQPCYDLVEDSDLEYELKGRANYTKYCEPRPVTEDTLNASNDSEGYPQFIEMEPQIPCVNAMSFLKNTAPLRYTELTEENLEDHHLNTEQMRVFIRGFEQGPNDLNKSFEHKKPQKELKRRSPKPKPSQKPSLEKAIEKSYKNSAQNTPRSKVIKVFENERNPSMEQASPRQANRMQAMSPRGMTIVKENTSRLMQGPNIFKTNTDRMRERLKNKNTLIPKSIEELKVEKMTIFNKMTLMQERIIEILDKLRYNLLEVYVPESSYEKTRRQKNAFEFSVRFSRNFLYPLKGMIDDLKGTTVEQLNSASSNDACGRVAAIYGLILQSLQTYLKQLRYFLLDQVPQKLTSLIEMMLTTTNICLEKGIFDKNDAIIEAMQERCAKFQNFLDDMHEERFMSVRDPRRKVRRNSKYDLKMFMNDLNMYEPKLVPKATNRRHLRSNTALSESSQRERKRTKKGRKTSSSMLVSPKPEETIATHVQNGNKSICNSEVVTSLQSIPSAKEVNSNKSNVFSISQTVSDPNNPLNKAILEALQVFTKEQVRQVLQPILETLGNVLDKQKNSEIVEKILSAFNTKYISTTKAEPYERSDDIAKEVVTRKVVSSTVSDKTPSDFTQNTSKAYKTAKQTKQIRRQESHEALGAVGSRGAAEAAAPDTYTQQHSTTDEDDDIENNVYKNIGNNNNKNNNSICKKNNNNINSFPCKVMNHPKTSSLLGMGDSIFIGNENDSDELTESNEDNDGCQFNVVVVNSRQHQQELPNQKTEIVIEELSLQDLQPKQKHKQALHTRRAQTERSQKQQTKSHNYTPPLSSKLPKKRGFESSSSLTTSNEALRQKGPKDPPSRQTSSARFSRRPFRKRRDPMHSPPPAPAATPSTSARSTMSGNLAFCSDFSSGSDVDLIKMRGACRSPFKSYIEYQKQQCNNNSDSESLNSIPKAGEQPSPKVPVDEAIRAAAISKQVKATQQLRRVPLTSSFNKSNEQEIGNEAPDFIQRDGVVHMLNTCLLKDDEVCSLQIAGGEANQTIFNDAFKDIKDKKMPLYANASPYEPQAEAQMLRLNTLRMEIQQQEKKQEVQLRALSELNHVAQKIGNKPTSYTNLLSTKMDEVDTADGKQAIEDTSKQKRNVDEIIQERNKFLESCKHNRFYANPNYEEPWKIFSKISEKIANEIVNSVEEDFTVGVSKFVKDFLQLEKIS